MTATVPVGTITDRLNMTCHLADDELVAAAVVVLKVLGPEGQISLRRCRSEGLDWVNTIGILRGALITQESDIHSR